MRLRLLISAAAVFSLTACVGRVVGAAVGGEHIGDVNVTALAATPMSTNTSLFCVFPANDSIAPQDLLYVDLKQTLEKALSIKGFVPAQSIDDCQQAILMAYGYGPPRTSVNLAQIPLDYLASSTRQHDQGTDAVGQAEGTSRPWLVLTSVNIGDRTNAASAVESWKTISVAADKRTKYRDLRLSVSYMISATMNYFGRNTDPAGERVRVRAWDNNWEALNKDKKAN